MMDKPYSTIAQEINRDYRKAWKRGDNVAIDSLLKLSESLRDTFATIDPTFPMVSFIMATTDRR